MAKRAKTIFPTDEIAHLWMHQTQGAAYNQARNFYFEAATIFSYGGHFPIARHVTGKNGKSKAILFTTRGYSVTTSKHISLVRRAIPDATLMFYVPKMSAGCSVIYDHEDNLKHFATEAVDILAKSKTSRTRGTRLLAEAFGYRDTAKAYAKFFGVTYNADDFKFLPKPSEVAELTAKAQAKEARAAEALKVYRANSDVRWAAKQAKWEEQRRINALKDAEKIELWKAGSTEVYPSYSWPTMLRIRGSEVETSRGARVPVEHGARALALVRKVMARGEAFVSNGHTCPVGVYKIDRIDVDGTVHAGCHVIPWPELERIAPELEGVK